MLKEDEELLKRLQKERDEHGLVLENNVDERGFHKVLKRLIDEPPAPKMKKRRSTKPVRHAKKR
jgi:hypothetical protein